MMAKAFTMNWRQRGSRYGTGVLFMAGLAGILLIAAGFRQKLQPDMEIWLGIALVVVLILHARMGFAFTKAQAELEMLRKLSQRYVDVGESKLKTVLKFDKVAGVSAEDAEVLERVKTAVENDWLDLYLQPIVSLPQRKVRYYEAFSRMRDRDGRVLSPAYYLEAAERADKIAVIDNMILLRCVQAFRKLRERDSQLALFCNLSPASLFDTEFFNHFTDYLEQNHDLSSRLVFEFTYPAVQMMHPKVEANLDAIARRGFTFSIDHVQSLDIDWQALRRRHFRFAKAPSSLLLAAAREGDIGSAKLRAFRKKLGDAGIDLVAEKIELETQMPEILALGLDYGQGNLFGPPRPADFYVAEHESADALEKAS
jgi:EAL domain-containing protein (putative c-di-GMP-specific phosphodiesterase class I)